MKICVFVLFYNSSSISLFFRRRYNFIKQIYKKSYIHHTYYKIAENKNKKEARNIKSRTKTEVGVATMSFIQSRDIICSSCSAYIHFMYIID